MKRKHGALALGRFLVLLGAVIGAACGGKRGPGGDPAPFAVPSSEIEPSGYRVAWGEHWFPARITHGSAVRGRVTLVNAGTEIWHGSVRCAHYFVPAGEPLVEGRDAALRLLFKRPVAPRQTVTLERFVVRAPDRPGDYVLVFDLVNEMVAWFSDRGADRLVVPVRVD